MKYTKETLSVVIFFAVLIGLMMFSRSPMTFLLLLIPALFVLWYFRKNKTPRE